MRGEREIATFKLPVKALFGRKFCGTDGSIGCVAYVSDREMIETVDECRALGLSADENKRLDKLEPAALGGYHFRIEWEH